MLGNNQKVFLGIRCAVASVVLAAGLGAVAPTTVVATPPGDDLEAAVGESIKTSLEAIDVIGFDLETKPKAAAASTNAVTVERAASAMFSVAERNADDLSKRRAKEGPGRTEL